MYLYKHSSCSLCKAPYETAHSTKTCAFYADTTHRQELGEYLKTTLGMVSLWRTCRDIGSNPIICFLWRINPKGKGLVLKTSSSGRPCVVSRSTSSSNTQETLVIASSDEDKKQHGQRQVNSAEKWDRENADPLEVSIFYPQVMGFSALPVNNHLNRDQTNKCSEKRDINQEKISG